MPVPVAPPNPGTSQVGTVIRTVLSKPSLEPGTYNILEDVASLLGGDAVAAAEVSGDVAVAADVGGGVAAATASLLSWPIILCLILIILALRIFESVIINAIGLIPFVGHKAVPYVQGFFRVLDGVENLIIITIENAVKSLFHDLGLVLLYVLGLNGIFPPSSQPPPRATANKAATEEEVYKLQQEINHLRNAVGAIQYVTTTKNVVVGVPQNLWDELHTLQSQIAQLTRTVATLASEVQRTENTANSVEAQQRALSSSVHQVRAIQVGYADLEHQVETLGNAVTSFTNTTSPRLQKVEHQQAAMLPLTLLLQPGLAGLKILRQLEDTPCMCPKFGNIPNELGTALALLEFAENG